jgi:hypothetical protein
MTKRNHLAVVERAEKTGADAAAGFRCILQCP